MSELEFLGALQVELLRHRELDHEHPNHQLFQTSTVQALLNGAFDGDVTLAELLEHGDLGLGTLDGLDGELIVLDGEAWNANLDGTLARPHLSSTTPYAVVVAFTPGRPVTLPGPRPYPPLAEVIAQQQVSDLFDVSGSMAGFCFPDALDGIEMVGWHLHFVTDDRARGGHVLSYTLSDADPISTTRRSCTWSCRQR
ncbi:MAG: acetolactate decarboxylase [Solirubrobacteraceae bacterium]